MKTERLVLVGGGAAIAFYIINQRKEKFLHSDNEDFREGFTAGFFTPGPTIILVLLGYATLS